MEAVDLLGVADHPALELLNSTSDAMGPQLEVLADGRGLLEWLTATGLLDVDPAAIRSGFTVAELDAVAAEARTFRERMRPVVASWSSARPIPASALRTLNKLLVEDRRHTRIALDRGRPRLHEVHDWTSAHSLLALPANAFADLLSGGEPDLVRQCEGAGCTMWFYDRTKGHRRRWCSMAVCGNRAKAAAHRERARKIIAASV